MVLSPTRTLSLRNKRMSSGVQWDEMNIMMTEHPPGKDYGHMKIEEPKTPFHEMEGDEEEVEETVAVGRVAETHAELVEK